LLRLGGWCYVLRLPDDTQRAPQMITRPIAAIQAATVLASRGSVGVITAVLFLSTAFVGAESQAQQQRISGLLVSRGTLSAAAERAESLATTGDGSTRASSAILAASIRERLREGDFKVGDRVVVAILSDVMHRDTVVVRAGRILELPGRITVPLTGVLRSEVQDRVTAEVLKYIKAQQVEVTPLMRVGLLGEVMHPGYFAFASDLPLADAIMTAGGPTPTADIERSIVRRGPSQFRSAAETSEAISAGLTLDQFGLNAGDELIVGRRHEFNTTTLFGVVGALASVITIYIAVHR
jgi:hypothetical protein